MTPTSPARWTTRRTGSLLPSLAVAVLLAGCSAGGSSLPPVSEPEDPTSPTAAPAGEVVDLRATRPEGIVVDPATGSAVVAVRDPAGLVVVSPDLGLRRLDVAGAARHLSLGPAGTVLVAGEDTDTLSAVDPATGEALWTLSTGRRPHDAAPAADGTVLSADEKGGAVLFSRDGRALATVRGIIQPGGVAVAGDTGVAVDVRGDTLHLYSMAERRETAVLDAGEGPTHVCALDGDRVAVADTVGDAVLVYDLGEDAGEQPRLLTSTPVPSGPYGIAYDAARRTLWVAGSGDNTARALAVGDDGSLTQATTLPTVEGPYSLAVDGTSGDLWIAGTARGEVQRVRAPLG